VFLVQLLVQIAVVALQEALADLQLSNLLVLCNDFDRVFATRKAGLEVCTAQRVLELEGVGVSVYAHRRNNYPNGVPLGSTGRALTHIFNLVAVVYDWVHGDSHGGINV